MATQPQGTNVRLTFSCSNLPSLDLLSKSDPFIVFYSRAFDGRWDKIGQTEVLNNNNQPTFSTTFPVQYLFESTQTFKAEVLDYDTLTSHDQIGYAEFNLGNVVAGYNSTLDIPILSHLGGKPLKKNARIQIHADQMTQSKLKAYLKIRIRDLRPSKGKLLSALWHAAKDDAFFELLKVRPDGQTTTIYQSEVVNDSQSPSFKEFKVCLGELCDGDIKKDFIFRVKRLTIDDRSEVMGEHRIRIDDIRVDLNQPPKKFDIFDKAGKDIADVMVDKCIIREEHTFLDYLKAGLDFSPLYCIDFTGSNGDPSLPRSLHYIDPAGRNQYIDAIRSVGTILQNYSGKNLCPAVGFGGFASIDGRPPTTSHCFPLSLNSQQPFFNGVEGIVHGYHNALRNIKLSGPTYVNELIASATASASRPYTQEYHHFTICVILTDGVVEDLEKTIDNIVLASDKPLAIIIIGIGNANFGDMVKLDGDGPHGLRSKRYGQAKSDIVQFVRFLDHSGNINSLAAETLREIPATVLNFMNMHQIKPAQQRQPPVIEVQQSVANNDSTITTTTTTTRIDLNNVPNVAPLQTPFTHQAQPQQQPHQVSGYPQAQPHQVSGYPQAQPHQVSGYPQPTGQQYPPQAQAQPQSAYPAPQAQAQPQSAYPAPQVQPQQSAYPAPQVQPQQSAYQYPSPQAQQGAYGYPQPTGNQYPPQAQPQSAYPAPQAQPQQSAYQYPPPQAQQGGYPQAQQGGYPQAQQGGYPQAQQGGYPQAQQGGYPQAQQGGYPQAQQGGYQYPPPQRGYNPY